MQEKEFVNYFYCRKEAVNNCRSTAVAPLQKLHFRENDNVLNICRIETKIELDIRITKISAGIKNEKCY